MTDFEITDICQALSDVNRLAILRMLTTGSKCACQLLEKLNITQPTLSYHMKVLCAAGLARCERRGKWNYYQIDDGLFHKFRSAIDGISCVNGLAERV